MEISMTNVLTKDRRLRALRGLGLGLAAGTLLIWSGLAHAAPPPMSFSDLAKKVTPAIVNIASIHKVAGPDMQTPDVPFNFPEDSPLGQFFKQFRDRMGEQGGGNAQPRMATALGSGFIIDPSGFIVTNNHVIDGADQIKVRLDDGTIYPAKLVGTDAKTDVALLKIDAKRPLPAVQFGNSDKAEVGDWVMAVGNPFGLGGTVTAGIISARDRNIDAGPYDDFLQIDASINQGNSGGPLFNMDGKVIGVNAAIYTPNGGSVGIGFAIPSNMTKTVVAQLEENGKVERGWLGVQIQQVTPEIAGAVGLKDTHGAMVVEITPDSPAARADLKQGDVIVGFAGQKIADPRGLARAVANEPAGSRTNLAVWRDGTEKDLSVVIGSQPDEAQVAAAPSGVEQNGSVHSADLNVDLAALTPESRAKFGIGDGVNGVLVLDVKAGTAFDQGLRPGDVIERIGQTSVTSPVEVASMLHKAESGPEKAVLLLVSRQGHDLFLGVKLGIA